MEEREEEYQRARDRIFKQEVRERKTDRFTVEHTDMLEAHKFLRYTFTAALHPGELPCRNQVTLPAVYFLHVPF